MTQVSIPPSPQPKQCYLGVQFDQIEESAAKDLIFSEAKATDFRYVVTPNVAHVVSILESPETLKPLFDGAWLSLCDSRVLSRIAMSSRKLKLPVVAGSDLTLTVLKSAAEHGTSVAVVGISAEDSALLQKRFPRVLFQFFDAPMNLRTSAAGRQACVEFVLQADADLVFLAVGMPQQEMIAQQLSETPGARGIGLCIGASIDFLVGRQTRAPKFMQRNGLEWLFRLVSDPRRLARRYLWESPKIFWYALRYRDS